MDYGEVTSELTINEKITYDGKEYTIPVKLESKCVVRRVYVELKGDEISAQSGIDLLGLGGGELATTIGSYGGFDSGGG